MRIFLLLLILCLPNLAHAEETFAPTDTITDPAASDLHQRDSEFDTHPMLSPDPSWAGALVLTIVGLFVAAAAIGPLLQQNLTEQAPPPNHSNIMTR